jgi:hypothetical protein
VAVIDAVLELVSGQGTPSKSGVGSIKNGAGQLGCPVPPEGSPHLILRPCCALPPAPPSSHTEASTGLSEELPKNGDVPKSPLSAIGSVNAVGRHETF